MRTNQVQASLYSLRGIYNELKHGSPGFMVIYVSVLVTVRTVDQQQDGQSGFNKLLRPKTFIAQTIASLLMRPSRGSALTTVLNA